jgi:hypothetical protein
MSEDNDCHFKERTIATHYLRRYYAHKLDSFLSLDELLKMAELEFNQGRRQFEKTGLQGPRYRVRIISYMFKNRPIIAILEHIGPCTLFAITVYPKD